MSQVVGSDGDQVVIDPVAGEGGVFGLGGQCGWEQGWSWEVGRWVQEIGGDYQRHAPWMDQEQCLLFLQDR